MPPTSSRLTQTPHRSPLTTHHPPQSVPEYFGKRKVDLPVRIADLVDDVPAGPEDHRLVPGIDVWAPRGEIARQFGRRAGRRVGTEWVQVADWHQVADHIPGRALACLVADHVKLRAELHRRDDVREPESGSDPELDIERVGRVMPANHVAVANVFRPQEIGHSGEVSPVRGAVDVGIVSKPVL